MTLHGTRLRYRLRVMLFNIRLRLRVYLQGWSLGQTYKHNRRLKDFLRVRLLVLHLRRHPFAQTLLKILRPLPVVRPETQAGTRDIDNCPVKPPCPASQKQSREPSREIWRPPAPVLSRLGYPRALEVPLITCQMPPHTARISQLVNWRSRARNSHNFLSDILR